MAKTYVHTPLNYNDIKNYVVEDVTFLQTCMLDDSKLYFYDTCAFRHHAQMTDAGCLFDLIKLNNGIVVLPRITIMELASDSKALNTEYIEYIKSMYNAGIKVCILEEEDLFEIMNICFSSNQVINNQLSWAVKTVKSRMSTIQETLDNDRTLLREVIVNVPKGNDLYGRFFSSVRNNKAEDDDLGEELIAICVHILSNMPGCGEHKCFVLTDDKGAVTKINQALDNVLEHHGIKAFSALTTSALAQRLYDGGLMSSKDAVAELLMSCSSDGITGFYGSEQYDLYPSFKSMKCEDLAALITDQGKVHVNY